jgi:hypothetical protein
MSNGIDTLSNLETRMVEVTSTICVSLKGMFGGFGHGEAAFASRLGRI